MGNMRALLRRTAQLAVAVAAAIQCSAALAQSHYTVTDLGTLGGPSSTAYGINNLGHVVGQADRPADSNGIPWPYAFLYTAAGMRDLGSLTPLDPLSTALGINDRDDVVGISYTASFSPQPFLWQNGLLSAMTLPPPINQFQSIFGGVPGGINNNGDVAGTAYSIIEHNATGYPCIWISGVPQYLDLTNGGAPGGATNINDARQVVGGEPALLWDFGKPATLLVGGFSRALAINQAGVIVGSGPSPTSSQSDRAWVWNAGNVTFLDTLGGTQGSAKGVNRAGVVVGNSFVANDRGIHGFVSEGTTVYDLNSLLVDSGGVVINDAVAINEAGQIAANGTTADGQAHAFLLTPAGSRIPSDNVQLLDAVYNMQPVCGVVCDNLAGMPEDKLNRLVVNMPDGYSPAPELGTVADGAGHSTDGTTNNVGRLAMYGGKLTYVPPLEFNEIQTPQTVNQVTKAATRSVFATINAVHNGQLVTFAPKEIVLARPPVILVHGINSKPSSWSDFMFGISRPDPVTGVRSGTSIPFARADHSGVLGGNGPVESAAETLRMAIGDPDMGVMSHIRKGEPLPDGQAAWIGSQPALVAFDDLSRKGRFAIKRVDVVAWSYGGVITRWYTAADGSNISSTWYGRAYGIELPTPKYGGDIRKVFTLGSMWRGVPLANYLNEALYKPAKGARFGGAPVNYPPLGFHSDIATVALSLPFPVKVPSMEVMAIDSKWMLQLNYGSPDPATPVELKPFHDDIAYGSVAGDDQRYPVSIPLGPAELTPRVNVYAGLDIVQLPTWFPYLPLEQREDSTRSYSDGLVPIWTAAIPGSYKIAPTTHAEYPADRDTQDYVVQWLNNANLPTGVALNKIWRNPAQSSVSCLDLTKTWSFATNRMAPYPQCDLYQQVSGTGRLDPEAWGGNQPNLQVTVTRQSRDQTTGDIVFDISLQNVGFVVSPGSKVTGASLKVGPVFGPTSTSVPIELGTIRVLHTGIATLRFPGSIGAPGKKGHLSVTVASLYPQVVDATPLAVTLP
jgi:probable HAF family extracellular repeat protein